MVRCLFGNQLEGKTSPSMAESILNQLDSTNLDNQKRLHEEAKSRDVLTVAYAGAIRVVEFYLHKTNPYLDTGGSDTVGRVIYTLKFTLTPTVDSFFDSILLLGYGNVSRGTKEGPSRVRCSCW